MNFNFYLPVNICFGSDALNEPLSKYSGVRLFVMASKTVASQGVVSSIIKQFNSQKYSVFTNITPNPDIKEIEAAYLSAKELDPQAVLAIGGGSVLDAAKFIAVMLSNNGDISACFSKNKESRPPIPLICMPTTSGTGSEVTNVSVISDGKDKRPYVSNALWPQFACVKPELSYSMPQKVAAQTGWDAFCHALEAYWSKSANPISDILAVKAISLILSNIENSVVLGKEDARDNMSLASLLAGIAFSQTRTTAPHAVSFSLTSEFGLSHGRACAITLPAFLNYCNGFWDNKQQVLLDNIGLSSLPLFVDTLISKMQNTGMPTKLCEVGITKEDLPYIAKDAISHNIAHALPRELTVESLQDLLARIL